MIPYIDYTLEGSLFVSLYDCSVGIGVTRTCIATKEV